MDESEAKLILASHTIGKEPIDDPQYESAMEIMRGSPELSAWWEEVRKADAALQDKIQGFSVPSDLRASLNASVGSARQRRTRRRRFTQFLAMAAGLAILVNLGLDFLIDNSDEYSGPLADRAYQYSYDGPKLTYFNKDTQKLKDWLEEQDFVLPSDLPPKLLAEEGIGCRPLNWSESRVAIMCFNAETVYHLFVGKEEEFENFDASDDHQYEYKDTGWTVTRWTSDGYALVLTAKATPETMFRYFASN